MNPSQVLDSMIADSSINGQHVDVDHEFGGQCWDLVELFAERCGVPKEPWAIPLGPNISAHEAWTYYDQSPHMQKYFDRVPAGQQQKGDITIYWKNQGDEGHIAISLGGSVVFEENADPDGAPAHVYNNRSSQYLLGALRLKEDNNMKPQRNQIILAYKLAFGPNNPPTEQQIQAQLGQPDLSHVLISIEGDSANAWAALHKQSDDKNAIIDDLRKQAGGDATVLKPGKYIVN